MVYMVTPSMPPSVAFSARLRSRWQFSLRGLLLAVSLCATLFATVGYQLQQHRLQLAALRRLERHPSILVEQIAWNAPPWLGGSSNTERRWTFFDRLISLRIVAKETRDRTDSSAVLNELARFDELESLGLDGFSLTTQHIETLGTLTNLRQFDLIRCDIEPAALVSLQQHPRLTLLGLSASGMGDDDLALLPQLPRLLVLDLSYNEITDQGVGQLVKFPRLVLLNLSATAVNDDAWQRLVAQLPDLQVLDD